jgi:hypothetical protein
LLQLGKTVIIKEALANGRVFKNEKFSHYQKLYQIVDSMAKKISGRHRCCCTQICG